MQNSFTPAQNLAATRIQSVFRGHRQRLQDEVKVKSATRIQRAFRAHFKQKSLLKFKPIWKQQKDIERQLKKTRSRLLEKEQEFRELTMISGSKIKTFELHRQNMAAIIIQKYFRSWSARKLVRVLLKAARSTRHRPKPDAPKWQCHLDDGIETVQHNSKFSDLEAAKSRMMDRLYLEQQKRSVLPKPIDTNVLAAKLTKVSLLLDQYYQPNQEIGPINLQDLSFGCHRSRQEIEKYIKGLVDSSITFENAPPNYPISSKASRLSKHSHSAIKQAFNVKWYNRVPSNGFNDSELEVLVNGSDEKSLRIY